MKASSQLVLGSKLAQAVARRLYAAQDALECSPTPICKLSEIIMRLVLLGDVFVAHQLSIVTVCVGYRWPKTILLPGWPRDATRVDTPSSKESSMSISSD